MRSIWMLYAGMVGLAASGGEALAHKVAVPRQCTIELPQAEQAAPQKVRLKGGKVAEVAPQHDPAMHPTKATIDTRTGDVDFHLSSGKTVVINALEPLPSPDPTLSRPQQEYLYKLARIYHRGVRYLGCGR